MRSAPHHEPPSERSQTPNEPPEETPPSLSKRFASKRTLLSFLFAFALLAFFLSRQDPGTLHRSWQQIQSADPLLYLAALVTYYLAFPVRGLRWRILLRNSGEPAQRLPGVRDLSEIIYISWFANTLVPAKLGDVYRGWLLRRTSGASWTHSMGTIVAERVLDVIVLVTLMVTTGFLTYGDVLARAAAGGPMACLRSGFHPRAVSCTLLQLFVLGGVGILLVIVSLIVFARYGTHLERVLPDPLSRLYLTFSNALVLSFGRFRSLLSLSVLGWIGEGTAFWLVGLALGQSLPLPVVVFFSLLGAFITVIPVTPGGLGFEPLLAGALTLRGYDSALALALILVYRTISYLSLVVGGLIVFLVSEKTK